MPRLSKLLEKLEDRVERRWGSWAARHKIRLRTHLPLFLIVAYFYGMFLNSLKLGIAATFHTGEETVESIWVFNPFFNLLVLVTPFGLGVTAVLALLTCLITKKAISGFPATSTPETPGALISCPMPPTVPPVSSRKLKCGPFWNWAASAKSRA